MAVFNYKVVDKNGKNKKGTIEAPNRDGAEKKLKADGYAIMSLERSITSSASSVVSFSGVHLYWMICFSLS